MNRLILERTKETEFTSFCCRSLMKLVGTLLLFGDMEMNNKPQ